MATIYKFRQVGEEPLVARAFADGEEIHVNHPLRSCVSFQWFYNDLLNDEFDPIEGATEQMYNVDLNSIGNSGAYFCRINIGSCPTITETETVSIIECIGQDPAVFPSSGATGQLQVDAPHYETVVASAEGNDWINVTNPVPCTTQTANVCSFISNFTLDDVPVPPNNARRGQPSLTVGDLTCYYNIRQDYDRGQAGTPLPDNSLGPFINLSQNGPTEPGNTITVTSTTGITVRDGDPAADTSGLSVAFSGTGVTDNGDGTASVVSTSVGMVTVTATVTDSLTGQSNTATIVVMFNQSQTLPTTLERDIGGVVSCYSSSGRARNRSARNRSLVVNGGGNTIHSLVVNPVGFFNALPPDSAGATVLLTINGPGRFTDGTNTISITPPAGATDPITVIKRINNAVGTYTWTLEVTSCPMLITAFQPRTTPGAGTTGRYNVTV